MFSSIDEHGRYAYANQPRIAHWNLVRLAETLLPLLGEDENEARAQAQAAIDAFPSLFEAALSDGFRAKLGLRDAEPDDTAMVQNLLDTMAANEADFTLTFRALSDGVLPEAFDAWRARWQERLRHADRDLMRAANPAFIPRNHRVEGSARGSDGGRFRAVRDAGDGAVEAL